MSTTNTDFLPNATGLNLGSPDQRWDGYFDDLVVTGTINNGLSGSDSVQLLSTSQTVGFGNAVHTLIIATGGLAGINLTLPSASSFTGQVIKIKKDDLNFGAINILGPIDGGSNYSLTNQKQYVCLESGNGEWQIVGNN